MVMPRIHLAALVLTATALFASGCGTSKSSENAKTARPTESVAQTQTTTSQTTAPTGPLTRAQLIAAADANCRRVNARIEATVIRTPQDYITKLQPLAAYEQSAATELGKLSAPASMAGKWKEIVAAKHTIATSLSQLAEYAVAKNTRLAQLSTARSGKAQKRLTSLTSHLGFKECGQLAKG
jgi:hypothetical protein